MSKNADGILWKPTTHEIGATQSPRDVPATAPHARISLICGAA